MYRIETDFPFDIQVETLTVTIERRLNIAIDRSLLRINQEKISGLPRCESTDRSSHCPHRISIQFFFLDSLIPEEVK